MLFVEGVELFLLGRVGAAHVVLRLLDRFAREAFDECGRVFVLVRLIDVEQRAFEWLPAPWA